MSEDRPDLDEPLATPEQDAFITSLLAGLGTDDPPMPDYVAARLTAALAKVIRRAHFSQIGGPVRSFRRAK